MKIVKEKEVEREEIGKRKKGKKIGGTNRKQERDLRSQIFDWLQSIRCKFIVHAK